VVHPRIAPRGRLGHVHHGQVGAAIRQVFGRNRGIVQAKPAWRLRLTTVRGAVPEP
jgi:hypothetical protein